MILKFRESTISRLERLRKREKEGSEGQGDDKDREIVSRNVCTTLWPARISPPFPLHSLVPIQYYDKTSALVQLIILFPSLQCWHFGMKISLHKWHLGVANCSRRKRGRVLGNLCSPPLVSVLMMMMLLINLRLTICRFFEATAQRGNCCHERQNRTPPGCYKVRHGKSGA